MNGDGVLKNKPTPSLSIKVVQGKNGKTRPLYGILVHDKAVRP